MKLSVLERVVLLNLLPQEATFANLKLIRVAKETLSFTDEENQKLNFRIEGAQTLWDEGIEEREFLIGEVASQLIVEALEKLDKDKKLREEHFSVYEKFVK